MLLILFLVCHLKVVLLCYNVRLFILQVHYDLGGIYFQQGCSDPSANAKAQEHFRKTRELLAKVGDIHTVFSWFPLFLFWLLFVGCSDSGICLYQLCISPLVPY